MPTDLWPRRVLAHTNVRLMADIHVYPPSPEASVCEIAMNQCNKEFTTFVIVLCCSNCS